MKTRFAPRPATFCLFFVSLAGFAHGETFKYWNVSGTGGDGIWGTGPGDKNWNPVPGALAGNTAWQDPTTDVAVFQDATGGIVTVFDTVQTAGIIQNGANYTINAGTIMLVPDSGSNVPFVNVQGGMLTIDLPLAGSAGLLKTGGGTLLLTSSNPFTGPTAIQGGTLNLAGSLASTALSISSGATLLNQNGGLSNSTTLANAGSLTLNANDTIARYISNGGNLTAGAGTLFSNSDATLNNGSTVAGRLYADHLTSNGTVTMSGIVTTKSTTSVQSGTLNFTGTLTTTNLNIASGTTLIQNGKIGPSSVGSAVTVVTNKGSLLVEESAIFKSYISNGGLLDIRGGRMGTQTVTLNDGSTTKGGPFSANLITTNGAVRIENAGLSARTTIASGVLDLAGSLSATQLGILAGASLLNQSGGLSNRATLANAGSLTLDGNDTIASYISNGGTLSNGAGTLFTTSTTLNDGSTVAGLLNAGTFTSYGSVRVTGTVVVNDIDIASGTLTNTGTLGNLATIFNINQGATLAASGLQQYAMLTTSGAGPGTWLGDLVNTRTIAPGGVGAAGILAVEGNFSQSPSGMLKFDLAAAGSDLLDVSGSAMFNGALELNQSGATIAPFVPVTVVSASAYSGNITSLSENLDGAVFFNPGNGTVTRIGLPSGNSGSFFGATRNQTATWISLYDDVIDPGITNITADASGYNISSGIADAGNPDLLWALSASFTPEGLNVALLNRLSPEVYGSFSDYAMQSTRAHQRSALSAPPLAPREGSTSGIGNSSKSGAKDGVAAAPASLAWEAFAAVDHFRAGTGNSRNQADYDFEGMGLLAGTRTQLGGQTKLAFYLGADSGTIDGELIDADALGWNFGVIGEHLLDEKSRTRLTAGASYGHYQFEGTRASASATFAGWLPGKVDFDDVDAKAFDFFVAVDGVAWQRNALTLVPSAGLRYAMSTMDSFGESTGGAPGSPIALDVSRDRHESLLLELGLRAQVEVNENLALWAEGGVNIGLLDNDRVIAARFAKGERMMRAAADGLDDDSIYLGLGAAYQITESVSAVLGYRADLRSGADPQQELRLSSSWRF